MANDECDYIVVGSGAGGGTVAARLAEAGYHVILLEAGGDPRRMNGDDPAEPADERLPDDYDVPAFHPFASENAAMSWNFFVRHYADDQQQRRDPAYRETWAGRPVDGVLYPRGSCLGGCTAHNAMIFIAPPAADWDAIAEQTGDQSWAAASMTRYFARLENCNHRWFRRSLAKLGWDSTGHGWKGWLHIQKALPLPALEDHELVKVVVRSAEAALGGGRLKTWLRILLHSFGDPNDSDVVRNAREGLFYTPLTTHRHRRGGTRERVLEVAKRWPDRLEVRLHSLATRVVLDSNQCAVGVEYRPGPALYRAHRRPASPTKPPVVVRARKEVILAGGAFNTPQLLMLSGIGPSEQLRRLGIDVRVELPGVGQNLQDRYEAGVVNRMAFDSWPSLRGAKFRRGDKPYRAWSRLRRGMYISNGAGLTVVRKSASDKLLPDLFCMALLATFKGYFPGYSQLVTERSNILTWCLLKAHTLNRAGQVSLRSADPLDPPKVNFHYFEEGSDGGGDDLRSVVEGIRFIRSMTAPLRRDGTIVAEEVPGPAVQSDEALRTYVRDHAWGHHACGTCAIGKVIGTDFRVFGVGGLRVVDASVFPRIPGYFIASAVYMIGEKAADVILAG